MRRHSLALDHRSVSNLSRLAAALDLTHSAVVRCAIDFLAEHVSRADPKTLEAARDLARSYTSRNA